MKKKGRITLKLYYSDRAKEYEKVYFREDAVRQREQLEIQNTMKTLFKNEHILEVACGTGYWTQFVAQTASHITAIDFSNKVLDIAKKKTSLQAKLPFIQETHMSLIRYKEILMLVMLTFGSLIYLGIEYKDF